MFWLSSKAWNGIAGIIAFNAFCFGIYVFQQNKINKIQQNLRMSQQKRIKIEQENKKMEILVQTKTIHEQQLQKTIEQDKKIIDKLTQSKQIQNEQLKRQNQSNIKVIGINEEKYISGQYVEQQLKQNIQKQVGNKPKIIAGNYLLFILGVPGIGKSTALVHLVSNWRDKKDKKVYYLNLKDQETENVQNLKLLLKGIKLKYTQTLQDHQKILIIIDDINKLEKIKNQQQYSNILSIIVGISRNKKFNVVCVSSSSYFVEKMKEHSQMNKTAHFEIIQDLKQTKYREFAKKIIRIFEPNISQKLSEQIIEQQLSLRDIGSLIQSLKLISSQQDKLAFIEKHFKAQKLEKNTQIFRIIKKLKNIQLRIQLTKNILDSQTQLDMMNCKRIYKKIQDNNLEQDQTSRLKEITEELDRKNLIIFCRPRSKLERQAFKEKYQDWKKIEK